MDNTISKDLERTCVECNEPFVVTIGEQTFFRSKQPPLHFPKRCSECRAIRRELRDAGFGIDKPRD